MSSHCPPSSLWLRLLPTKKLSARKTASPMCQSTFYHESVAATGKVYPASRDLRYSSSRFQSQTLPLRHLHASRGGRRTDLLKEEIPALPARLRAERAWALAAGQRQEVARRGRRGREAVGASCIGNVGNRSGPIWLVWSVCWSLRWPLRGRGNIHGPYAACSRLRLRLMPPTNN